MSVSHTQSSGNFGDVSATASRAFTVDVTAGSLIVVCCNKWDSGASNPFEAVDCAKSAGTATLVAAFTLDNSVGPFDVGGGTNLYGGVWSAIVDQGGSLTVTVGGMGSGSYSFLAASEFPSSTGWDASRLEAAPTPVTDATDNPTSITCTSFTSTGAALSVGLWGGDGTQGGPGNITETTGTLAYEEGTSSSHLIGSVQYQTATSATAFAPSWTFSGYTPATIYGGYAIQAVYKEAGGPSTTPVSSDFVSTYEVVGQITKDLAATYNIGSISSVSSTQTDRGRAIGRGIGRGM